KGCQMKIGVISDIHGNHYALEEVLKTARKKNIEKLLILGDVVGYYYHPEKVLEILNDWDYTLIRGNHEKILEQILLDEKKSTEIQKKYGSGHIIALKKLSKQQLQSLIKAQEKQMVLIDRVKILMCHCAR